VLNKIIKLVKMLNIQKTRQSEGLGILKLAIFHRFFMEKIRKQVKERGSS